MSGRNKADSRVFNLTLRGVSLDVTRDQAPADLSPKILIRYYGQVRRAALLHATNIRTVASRVVLITEIYIRTPFMGKWIVSGSCHFYSMPWHMHVDY